ncbi:hypothetical protein QVD17_26510 [Tagetes erecta]|uniref:Uncharacterized protein n=1 Tax=Tagetes erecta TaxID=13708 RepID=A0AAD8K969_TARER|nr:hypothetical protein QVD17_26510 [Tagetes erecta]
MLIHASRNDLDNDCRGWFNFESLSNILPLMACFAKKCPGLVFCLGSITFAMLFSVSMHFDSDGNVV